MSETTVTTTEQTTVVETVEQTVVIQVITPEGTELVETEQGTTVVEVFVQGPQGPPGEGADVLTQSITNGDTTHAPSGDAVFDALAVQTAATAAVAADLAAHEADTANPHATTAAQVGADATGTAAAAVSAHAAASDPHPGYVLESTVGVAGGVAPLDGSGKVASAYLPSYVDDVLEFDDFASLPPTGETGKIYVALDTNKEYRWSGSAYVELVASPGSTDAVPEGSTNLYFTAARVRATVLTGLSLATKQVIAATDTVLQAFGYLQAQITGILDGSTFHALTSKSPPADADEFPIADSAASYALKKLTWANLKAALGSLTNWLSVNALGQGGATSGQVLVWNGSAWAPATVSASPAGSSAELQYRNGSSFGAAAGTYWDATNGRLSIGAGSSPSAVLHVKSDSASEIVGIDQGATSQTAALREFRNSAGTVLASVSASGAGLFDGGSLSAPGLSLSGVGAGIGLANWGGSFALVASSAAIAYFDAGGWVWEREEKYNRTITAGGTTGNQTINKAAGTVNFAAAASSLTVTNNKVNSSSIVYAVVRTNDSTAKIKNVVPGSGSFVINLESAATAETSVGWIVTN